MSFKNSVQAPAGSVIKVTLGHVTLLLESKYTSHLHTYLSTDYFGTRLIIFDNNMNAIGNHFLYQVYSIHVIVEYNLSGSKII